MLGKRLNAIFLLLATTLISCGQSLELSMDPQFVAGQILVPGDGSGLSANRRLARTWRDYDGDGVSDRHDWDIDGDGVANLVDQYPFDETKWGEDLNANGITDFVDLHFSAVPEARELSSIQENIFKKTGVIVVNANDEFSLSEWREMSDVILSAQITDRIRFVGLKTIVRYDQNSKPDSRRADYDSGWLQISFYPNELHRSSVSAFRGSLVHELGHVHAFENPDQFLSFKQEFNIWQSPSRYGLTSAEEGYAENFAFMLFGEGVHFDFSRFDLLMLPSASHAH